MLGLFHNSGIILLLLDSCKRKENNEVWVQALACQIIAEAGMR